MKIQKINKITQHQNCNGNLETEILGHLLGFILFGNCPFESANIAEARIALGIFVHNGNSSRSFSHGTSEATIGWILSCWQSAVISNPSKLLNHNPLQASINLSSILYISWWRLWAKIFPKICKSWINATWNPGDPFRSYLVTHIPLIVGIGANPVVQRFALQSPIFGMLHQASEEITNGLTPPATTFYRSDEFSVGR